MSPNEHSQFEFTNPGAIPFTRTAGARPRASSRVRPASPALAVAYAVLLAPPPNADIDTVLTTAPFEDRSAPARDWVIQKALSRLMRKIRSQKSSVSASRSAGGIGVRVPGAPALLTR